MNGQLRCSIFIFLHKIQFKMLADKRDQDLLPTLLKGEAM
jgi:hypothetical protein